MKELTIGRTDRLAVDVGPVISQQAKSEIDLHIETMRQRGHRVIQPKIAGSRDFGTFVTPTLIEVNALAELEGEIFGPVLHVLRYARKDSDRLVENINATGYALTFGLHSRISDRIAEIRTKVVAGNIYVNRNIIGAVVGVQPFGGNGLSGTGPKAGGPLYLRRLGFVSDQQVPHERSPDASALRELQDYLAKRSDLAVRSGSTGSETSVAALIASIAHGKISTEEIELRGPVGEQNLYAMRPRGKVLLFPETEAGLFCQLAAVAATENLAVIAEPGMPGALLDDLPQSLSKWITRSTHWTTDSSCRAALIEGEADRVQSILSVLSGLPGPLIVAQSASRQQHLTFPYPYDLVWLMEETAVSINTSAAGCNANLMKLD